MASRAAEAVGARVVAIDLAPGMLLEERDARPPATVGDSLALPFGESTFDVVLAAFSLNHLERPEAGVAEAARVGGVLVGSTYAVDDDHPVKDAVEEALTEVGWSRPAWYDAVKRSMEAWGTIDAAEAVIRRGRMQPIHVRKEEVKFPELSTEDLVAWRMGMAQSAPFVAALTPNERAARIRRAVELLGPNPPPLVRRVILLAAR